MRIISGYHKGRRITAPKILPVRPTTDMAKEALFNILNNRFYFDELSVLDLYAGTGNISFEFASRGTKDLTAVDQYYGCIKFINSISDELELNIKTIKTDVLNFLNNTTRSFDIVFADPPYNLDREHFEALVECVLNNKILNSDGLLIVEHSKHTDLSQVLGFNEQKRYGGTSFSFFQKA
jgi:16S rRNA (guanine(966)-N(2))-methyltransferase RsmD